MKPCLLTKHKLSLANDLWRLWKWDTLKFAEHLGVPEATVWNCLSDILEYTPKVRERERA